MDLGRESGEKQEVGRERETEKAHARERMNAKVNKGSFVAGGDLFFLIIIILTCYRVLFFQPHL